MSTLTEFLLARIHEDEADARAVIEADYSGRWEWDSHRLKPYRSALINDRGAVVLPSMNDDVYPSAAVAHHIARHDPSRVMAECAAKRQIVGLHRPEPCYGPTDLRCQICSIDRWEEEHAGGEDSGCYHVSVSFPCPTLHALASVYADHPDYREEWKPAP